MSSPLPRFSPRRPLGRTGFVATRLGIGDLADRAVPAPAAASLAAAARFAPLTADELHSVSLRAAEAVAGKGPCWWNPL